MRATDQMTRHSSQITPFLTWRRALPALVSLAAVAIAMPHLRKPAELSVYVSAAQRIMQGEEVYRPKDKKAFTYPPFFVLPFAPLAVMPAAVQRPAWWLCNLALTAVAAFLVSQLAWPIVRSRAARYAPPVWWNVALVALLAAKFMLMPLMWESHDLIILVLVLLCGVAVASDRQVQSGIWAGLAAACKATPLLLLPVMFWQHRRVAAVAMAATVLVATTLPDVLFPRNDGSWWALRWYTTFVAKVEVGSAPSAHGAWQPWNALNQSLSGTLHRLFTPIVSDREKINVAMFALRPRMLRLLTIVLDAAVGGWLAWTTWPRGPRRTSADEEAFLWLGRIGSALCAMLLLSPMSSTYHFCFLLVPITFCVSYWMYCERSAIVGVVLVVQLIVTLLSAQDLVGAWLADWLLACGVMTFDAALLLFGCGFILGWGLPRQVAGCASAENEPAILHTKDRLLVAGRTGGNRSMKTQPPKAA